MRQSSWLQGRQGLTVCMQSFCQAATLLPVRSGCFSTCKNTTKSVTGVGMAAACIANPDLLHAQAWVCQAPPLLPLPLLLLQRLSQVLLELPDPCQGSLILLENAICNCGVRYPKQSQPASMMHLIPRSKERVQPLTIVYTFCRTSLADT